MYTSSSIQEVNQYLSYVNLCMLQWYSLKFKTTQVVTRGLQLIISCSCPLLFFASNEIYPIESLYFSSCYFMQRFIQVNFLYFPDIMGSNMKKNATLDS